MDIVLPKKIPGVKEYGSIIFIHGGAWTMGTKTQERIINCKYYPLKGYVTTAINYHYIKDDYTIWDDMNDIELAIKKLKEFTEEKGYKLNGICIFGYSSGGHLTTIYIYSMPERSVIPIKFIVDKAGPIDFHSDTWNEWDYNEDTGPGLAVKLNGNKNFKQYMKGDELNIKNIPQDVLDIAIKNVSSVMYINQTSVPNICIYAGED